MRINMLEALSDNIAVDPEKCTTCGICVETCILDNLRLKLAPCRQACPLDVNCQGYVQLILRGREEEALEMVERELPFPAILGRLCSAPCEDNCHRKTIDGQAVAIRVLKRYVSDLAAGGSPTGAGQGRATRQTLCGGRRRTRRHAGGLRPSGQGTPGDRLRRRAGTRRHATLGDSGLSNSGTC